MPETRDKDNVDKILLLFDAIKDDFRIIDNANVTRTYTSYIKMVRFPYRKCEIIWWKKEELEKL